MVSCIQVASDKDRHFGRKRVNGLKKNLKLTVPVFRVSVAFKMCGHHANWTVLCRNNCSNGHPATDTWLLGIGRTAIWRKPMAVIIQTN